MTKEQCAFCGKLSVDITDSGDKACNACKAVQLNIGDENNPYTIVNCPKCGYRHQIKKNSVFFGDPTICARCSQTSYKWSV